MGYNSGVGATPVVDLELAVKLGDLADQVEALHGRIASTFDRPMSFNRTKSLVSKGATPVSTGIGGPTASVAHELRRLSIGPTPGVTLNSSGTLVLYRGTQDPAGTPVGGGIEITRVTVLPADATWSHQQIVIEHPDRFWIVWFGGTLNDQLVVDTQIIEYPSPGTSRA